MPDFRDRFTAREVCEGMLTEITVKYTFLPAREEKRKFSPRANSLRIYGAALNEVNKVARELLRIAHSPKRENGGPTFERTIAIADSSCSFVEQRLAR